jgi:mannose-1-phosphate guanylyltransferase/mannose-6-phosphate isomerase
MQTFVFILAGGSGTRLAPLSLTMPGKLPKQFLALVGERTMLQQTIDRIPAGQQIVVVPEEKYTAAVEAQIGHHKILAEPFGCNTAAAVALSARYVLQQTNGEDAIAFFLPADHIVDTKAFQKYFMQARDAVAHDDKIITIGIKPDRPETGYGYIETAGVQVKRFVEKPDVATARKYLEQGDFYWNAGMFAMRAKTILKLMVKDCPDVLEQVNKIDFTKNLSAEITREYTVIKQKKANISIDYAVMEKEAANMRLIPAGADLEWNDVGGWIALSHYIKPDTQNNLVLNYLKTKIQLENCRDLLVVTSENGILVTTQELGQRAKDIIPGIQAEKNQDSIDCQNVTIDNATSKYIGTIGLKDTTITYDGYVLHIKKL